MCASGKTTLASELARFFDCNIVHMDDFYYPRGTIDLSKSNDGNINLIRLREEIINKIHDDSFIYNVFSCKEQKIVSSEIVKHRELTIVEGSYSLNPFLGHYYDISIFLKVDEDEQSRRLKVRNPHNFNDFANKWIRLEKRYNKYYLIEKNANILMHSQ